MRLRIVAVSGVVSLLLSIFVPTTANAASSTGTGGVFVPSVGRVLDTRDGTGGYNTPMPAKSWRSVTVVGLAGIPNDGSVGAVSVVATVASITSRGQLDGRPDATQPATMLGYYGGDDAQNTSFSAVVAVSDSGTIDLKADSAVRLVLDVQGYYTADIDGMAPGGFVPMNGTRVADTRSGQGVPAGALTSGKSADIQITGQTTGVPANASAVVVNMIAVNTTAATGILIPHAAGSARPLNSFNYAGGVATSMQAQVPLSATGKITIYNQGSTANLVVDIQGYFTAASGSGAAFTPGSGRIYDTRAAGMSVMAANETRAIPVAGIAAVPVMASGINAVVLTLTALKSTSGGGSATAWAFGAPQPGITSINFESNAPISNTITVPLGVNGKINLANLAAATNYVVDVQGWYIERLPPVESQPTEVIPAEAPPVSPSVTVPTVREPGQLEQPPIDFAPQTPPTQANVKFLANGIPSVQETYAVGPVDGAKNTGLTPTLTGGVAGMKPVSTSGVEFAYTVCPASLGSCNSEKSTTLTSGWVSGGWKVPAGKLTANTTYRWSVSARNNPYIGTLFNDDWWFSTGASLSAPSTSDFEVTLKSPSSQQPLDVLTPTLTAGLRHAASQPYEYSFEVTQCSSSDSCNGGTVVATSGWIDSAAWIVPSGALVYNSAQVDRIRPQQSVHRNHLQSGSDICNRRADAERQ